MKLEFKGGKGETLLLVEDNEDVLDLLSELFSLSGYNVIGVKKVKEAFDKFEDKKGEISLVLSDVILPDGSGVELVENLLEKAPDLKVILTSGYVKDNYTFFKIKERGYVFLNKPFDLSCLLKTVKELLDNRSVN